MAGVLRGRWNNLYRLYFKEERTMTGIYYAALLDGLVDEIRKKRSHLKKKKIPFHDDNAPSHISNIAQAKKA